MLFDIVNKHQAQRCERHVPHIFLFLKGKTQMFEFNYRNIIITSKDFIPFDERIDKENYVASSREAMVHFCQISVSEQVVVSWCKNPEKGRSDFDTQISVKGILEYDEDRDLYRVLLNHQIYTYFSSWDVLLATYDGRIKTRNEYPTLLIN